MGGCGLWRVLVLGLALSFSSVAAFGVTTGTEWPAPAIKNYKEGTLAKDSLKGKVTIVNFWATWCAACKVELVEMEDIFRPLRAEANFQTAFVSLDKDPKKAAEWLESHMKEPQEVMKSLYVDPAFEAAETLSVDSFPMTFVIDQQGKVVHVQRGFEEGEGSTEQIAAIAQKLLKK